MLTHWQVRFPLKWLLFLAVTFLVLFPNPWQFARHLSHLGNLDAMVEPDAPQLQAWEGEFRARLAAHGEGIIAAGGQTALESRETDWPGATSPDESALLLGRSPTAVQREVERFVYQKVQYQWDWETWGSADYMPTVGEMFTKASQSPSGQVYEDCDGRAVVAASLMRRLGYQASLVTDLRHVWVKTPQGEWMGLGGRTAVISTPQGNRVDLGTVWANLPTSLSYGISVFPFWREVIILATAYLLLLHRRMSGRIAALSGLVLFQGLLFMRCGGVSPQGVAHFDSSWPALVGMLHLLAGFAVLGWTSHRARSAAAQHSPKAVDG